VSRTITVYQVFIDASGSSTAVPLSSISATLSAFVTNSSSNGVGGVIVNFTVTNYLNQVVATASATTAPTGTYTGIASTSINPSSLTLPFGALPIGVYAVTAVVGTGGCASSVGYLTIYDPNANFVTGGGWINSLAKAYVADEALIGKANFGFVSKYKKGSSQVDGNTEFQFKAGNFNFKSDSHDPGTLVISGAKATYRGVGTVNGSGSYGFMVSAIDGEMTGGGGTDKFRIKIWDKSQGNKVVYDNQVNTANTLDNADPITALGGGSIVIHEVKRATTKMEIAAKPIEIGLFDVKIYPNPAKYQFILKLLGGSDEKVEVSVYDILGRLVKHIANSNGQEIKFGDDLPSGSYIAIVSQGINQKTVRLIKQ
jgi:hypothetical protein